MVALVLGGTQAQFFTPSFQNYQTYAQRTVGYVAATVRPDFTARVVQQAIHPPATPVTYRFPVSGSDFAFRGGPTQQQNCAAMVTKPVDQRQMAGLCLSIFQAAQTLEGFRRNNLAAGLTLLIGASLQVRTGTELTEAETDALQRGLNDVLVDTGVMKGKPAEIQAMYEAAIMTGGLIAGIAQQGADDDDSQLTALARSLAGSVLDGFKLKP